MLVGLQTGVIYLSSVIFVSGTAVDCALNDADKKNCRVKATGEKMRLDKFLKVSRILKRRTVAQEACNGGKIDVNGRPAKPGCQLKIGDIVCVHFAGGALTFRVKDLRETVKKDEADSMYEIMVDNA